MSSIDYDRINFEDLPSNLTPVAARILNRMDKAIDDIAVYINDRDDIEYLLLASNWASSGDITYPYYYSISSTKYKDSDHPIAQVWGTNEVETESEINDIKKVTKVVVNNNGIKVYASGSISVNLRLILKKV